MNRIVARHAPRMGKYGALVLVGERPGCFIGGSFRRGAVHRRVDLQADKAGLLHRFFQRLQRGWRVPRIEHALKEDAAVRLLEQVIGSLHPHLRTAQYHLHLGADGVLDPQGIHQLKQVSCITSGSKIHPRCPQVQMRIDDEWGSGVGGRVCHRRTSATIRRRLSPATSFLSASGILASRTVPMEDSGSKTGRKEPNTKRCGPSVFTPYSR